MTSNFSISRRRLVAGAAGAATFAAAPAFLRTVNAQGLAKIKVQLGWAAQAEHGGMFQAVATGLYKERGLDVELLPGGPQTNTMQLFLAGMCDFIEADSFRAVSAAQEKLPAVAVAAYFQKDPRVLLSHPNTGQDSLAALKGKPLLVATAGRQTYWLWLKSKYGFTDDQLRPYSFSLGPWVVDKQASVQGYVTSEPFAARKAGVEPVVHLLADHGYEPYQNVTFATPKMVRENPAIVQSFVDGSARGWASFVNGNPAPGVALIRQANPQMGEDTIAYAIESMRKYGIVETAETRAGGIGTMSAERWKRFYDAMVAAGALKPGTDVRDAYTLQFITGKRG